MCPPATSDWQTAVGSHQACADLLLVDGDPTSDLTATSSICDVWRRGVRQAH